MSIIRRHKNDKFSVISNHCLQRSDISWKAKGIYAYLMTLPDDWVLHLTELINHATDGKDSTRTGFTELEEAGYILRERVRNESGHITDCNYDVYEFPNSEKPKADTPKAENPISVNPPLLKTNSKQRTDYTKNGGAISELPISESKMSSLKKWLAYKKEKGQSYKQMGIDALVKKWSGFTDQEIASAVDTSMANGWAGCFPERISGKQRPNLRVSASQNAEDYKL